MSTPHVTHGFVRTISRSLEHCELLHVPRQTLNMAIALQQHAAYVAALEAAGITVTVLPEEPDLPDSTFVEDTVIILDELSVICRLGCTSRGPEADKMESQITTLRPVRRIAVPGTLEGGDVLRIGRALYVGISSRTNIEGIRQLKEIVSRVGYDVIGVSVTGCLHLKTGVTSPAEGMLIANPDWVDLSPFRRFNILPLPSTEPWGANTLAVNGAVFVAESAPKTAELLLSKGLRVHRLTISELQKAEAGLTCLSVLY